MGKMGISKHEGEDLIHEHKAYVAATLTAFLAAWQRLPCFQEQKLVKLCNRVAAEQEPTVSVAELDTGHIRNTEFSCLTRQGRCQFLQLRQRCTPQGFKSVPDNLLEASRRSTNYRFGGLWQSARRAIRFGPGMPILFNSCHIPDP